LLCFAFVTTAGTGIRLAFGLRRSENMKKQSGLHFAYISQHDVV
jgi:hypothetical protein